MVGTQYFRSRTTVPGWWAKGRRLELGVAAADRDSTLKQWPSDRGHDHESQSLFQDTVVGQMLSVWTTGDRYGIFTISQLQVLERHLRIDRYTTNILISVGLQEMAEQQMNQNVND